MGEEFHPKVQADVLQADNEHQPSFEALPYLGFQSMSRALANQEFASKMYNRCQGTKFLLICHLSIT